MLQLSTQSPSRELRKQITSVEAKRRDLISAMIAWNRTDTPDADGGLPTGRNSTPTQVRAATRYDRAFKHVSKVAADIIEAPADTIDGLLLKIEALAVLSDVTKRTHGKVWSGTPDFSRWRPQHTGFYCDDAPLIALMTMRDDLNRMKKKEQR